MASKSVLTAAAPFAFVLRQMDVHLDGTRFDQWHHHGDLAAHKWTNKQDKQDKLTTGKLAGYFWFV